MSGFKYFFCSLFTVCLQVSLMLEEAFAAAGRLTAAGFPVGVQLASRLVPDVSFFLQSYVDNVRNMMILYKGYMRVYART